MDNTAAPKKSSFGRKIMRWTLLILFFGLAIFFYIRYFWVFGEGAKAGELNYVVHKGFLFKTYEGKLIQVGLRGQQGGMQSNEFIFSVADPVVAEKMMANSGMQFNLHYKEYMGALPWRGMSVFVVDSIISMKDPSGVGPDITGQH